MSRAKREHRDSWKPPRSILAADEWRLATTEDVEHTLSAAERMLKSSEEVMRHQQNTKIAVYSFAVVGVLSVATVIVELFGLYGSDFVFLLPVAAVCAMVAMVASLRLLVLARRAQSVFDPFLQSAMAHEMASAVESLYIEVAHREHWSSLRLSSTKARLSAFALHERQRIALRPIRVARTREEEGEPGQ